MSERKWWILGWIILGLIVMNYIIMWIFPNMIFFWIGFVGIFIDSFIFMMSYPDPKYDFKTTYRAINNEIKRLEKIKYEIEKDALNRAIVYIDKLLNQPAEVEDET